MSVFFCNVKLRFAVFVFCVNINGGLLERQFNNGNDKRLVAAFSVQGEYKKGKECESTVTLCLLRRGRVQ